MGRYAFGILAICYGVVSLVWHEQLQSDWTLPGAHAFNIVTAVVQTLGGAALFFPQTARWGAAALAAVYGIFAATWLPGIAAHPQAYPSYGNVFERLAFVAGAVIAFAIVSTPRATQATIGRPGVALLGACSLSFGIEQAVLLAPTARLVPKWLPPSGTFWAIATTVAFVLAAISLLTGRYALVASRLLAAMLLIFGIAVWIPIVAAVPSSHAYWGELLETLAIAAAAWMAADSLAATAPTGP